MSDTRNYEAGPNFFSLYESKQVSEEEIDDFIHYWHTEAPRGLQTLHEFLGLTWSEYALWVKQPDGLAQILVARKSGGPIEQHPRTVMKKTA